MPVVYRARQDIAAGRLWKARDRLLGAMTRAPDDEVLELLGEVYFQMGDLPRAGATWFASGRRGPEVLAALEAWRERYGPDPAQLWRSLPRAIRDQEPPAAGDLRREAGIARSQRDRTLAASGVPYRPGLGDRVFPFVFAAAVTLFITCAGVGFVTVLRWLF